MPKFYLQNVKFGNLILRKFIKFLATKCQILRPKCTKFNFSWGSAQTPPRELTALPRFSSRNEGLLLRGSRPVARPREEAVRSKPHPNTASSAFYVHILSVSECSHEMPSFTVKMHNLVF